MPYSQIATFSSNVALDHDNLSETIFQSFDSNINSCEYFNLTDATYDFDNKSSYLFIHLNISSLQAHFDELNNFLLRFTNPPSIIFLSETRINTNPLINIDIPNYRFVHFPSPTKAGGVGAYISSNLIFSESEQSRIGVPGCEDLWFDINLPGLSDKYIFGVIYRHPHNNLQEFLKTLDEKMLSFNQKGYKVLIFGDINIDVNANVTATHDYLRMIESNAFINLITKPTRITQSSQTTIDHILTNDSQSSITPGILIFSISDHLSTFCNIVKPLRQCAKNKKPLTFRNTKSIDGNEFRIDLENVLSPLVNEFVNSNITHQNFNNHFNKLLTVISEVIERHAPLQAASRKQKRLQQKPWLTKGLLVSIKNKQKLYYSCFRNGNDFDRIYYKTYANKLTRVKNLAKKLYYDTEVAEKKSNPRELWKLIKTVISTKRSHSHNSSLTNICVDDELINEPEEVCEHFNNYFVQVGESIANSIRNIDNVNFTSYLKNAVSQTIVLEQPTPLEVFNTIKTLNPNKASSDDKISSFFPTPRWRSLSIRIINIFWSSF